MTFDDGTSIRLRGRRCAGSPGRRPAAREEERVCRADGCGTRLSRYNPRELCHLHAPIRFPRIRGREVP